MSFITLKGVVTTAVIRGDDRIVVDTVSLIGLKFHTIRTATHSAEGGSREAEVAAAPIGHHFTAAGEGCGRSDKEAVRRFLDSYFGLSHSSVIFLPSKPLIIPDNFKPTPAVNELTAVQVSCVGLDVHDARDSLSDHDVSASVPLPHLKNCSGPCIRHIQVVCKRKIATSTFMRLVFRIMSY